MLRTQPTASVASTPKVTRFRAFANVRSGDAITTGIPISGRDFKSPSARSLTVRRGLAFPLSAVCSETTSAATSTGR